MTTRELLAGLLSVKCVGFTANVSLHMETQESFDMLAGITPDVHVYTHESEERGLVYDVAKLTGVGGASITVFGPERPMRPALKVVQ